MIFKKQTYDYLIFGLGNPGLQYEKTRHNAGFMAIDKIAEKYDCSFNKHKFESVYGECNIGGKRVLLVKPQTFMNLSGKSVTAVSSFYKVPASSIIVMFDDISLSVGKIRVRRKGSHGGHNGIKDIIELMGTDDIMRIKIGVGEKPNPEYDLKDWVLGKLPSELLEDFSAALENTVKAAEEIIKRGIDSAMNKYNG
ncbi:MAG: aminoacyl-tRNA hydrolase [Ruminococcaceae bacterium]|nr:aminoacyl-tRNA hydrolase [Oscillospiraceae bacterium]